MKLFSCHLNHKSKWGDLGRHHCNQRHPLVPLLFQGEVEAEVEEELEVVLEVEEEEELRLRELDLYLRNKVARALENNVSWN
ncbi:hypothetical protein AAHA92_24816 [Salvia divinorum]|uniref:Uncharacterized protein n=1 Tax=Salvia divinorum TaxID=28513 RepID=A0ABD1G8K8_SALDI